ncbi:protein PSY2 [Momordica charantia]|uniref:Protein PSY2 n=1 Tax=Momordica charantia TaxID=3673 RepID=A0A6J1C8Y2_MOMCH|nr:protein PSY2 [Momordica charantia]
MSLKLKSLLLLLLFLIFVLPFSSGMDKPLRDTKIADKSIFKVGGIIQMNARKLMTLDIQDYDETKANNRHDPKKPGNGKP